MSKIKVLFVERRFHEFVSIERVFRQVAASLDSVSFSADFQQLPFANGLQDTIRNLFHFKPKPADIYHMTGQSHYISLVLPKNRTVLTIHDLRFVHDRTGLRGWVLRKLLLDLPVRRLNFITAISDATRDEIVKYTGCDPTLIRVIENPVRDEFLQTLPIREFNKERPVILQIGITENKNIPRLIEALEGVSCRLVIIGRMSESVARLCEEFGVEMDNLSDLTDSEVVEQYQRADLVSFCSTYEGFGMPIIEAQALGKPVITSDLSPMKEVAGGSAVLIDPFSVEQIRGGILSIINDEELRDRLVKTGIENVRRFEAGNIARQYEDLYREIYSANSDN